MDSEPQLIWEDEDFLVCLKPPGLPSCAQNKSTSLSLADWLASYCPACRHASSDPNESGLCHRLDHDTSGLMIAAKSSEIFDHFRAAFSEGHIKKFYLGVVEGDVVSSLTLTHYLYGRYRRSKKVSASPTPVPRSSFAELSLEPVKKFQENDLTLLKVQLKTGFRHQIRAQLEAIGHPLCGDALYKSSSSGKFQISSDLYPSSKREFYLHASELSFSHPRTGELQNFISDDHPRVELL
ncbi:MAG: RluA family pseudouridine synthase [Bdellovibrionales bacterium]|nr:RluA family pseudouridine synthase [Bdellovibrionales bacterium]